MPIRSSDLRRQLLRVSPDTLVGAALKDLRARPRPTEWLLQRLAYGRTADS